MTQASVTCPGTRVAEDLEEVRLAECFRLAVRLMAAAVAIVAAVALLVRLTGSTAPTRAELRLGIGHPPVSFASFGSIVSANLRVALGPLLLAVLAQLFIRTSRAQPRGLIMAFDLVAVYLALSSLLVELGESIGAYGSRILVDLLSHGPFELSGFALFWSVYFACRRGNVGSRTLISILALAVSLIVLAAALETWAHS
jgi:hypothetical protein